MSMRARYGIAVLLVVFAVALCVTTVHKATREAAVSEIVTHDEIVGPAIVKAGADELQATVVTPHLESEITGDENVLWCASFQMAWNALRDLLNGPIPSGGRSEMVRLLNARTVTETDLDEASYVALAGYPTGGADDILDRIYASLEEKVRGAARPQLLSKPHRRKRWSGGAI